MRSSPAVSNRAFVSLPGTPRAVLYGDTVLPAPHLSGAQPQQGGTQGTPRGGDAQGLKAMQVPPQMDCSEQCPACTWGHLGTCGDIQGHLGGSSATRWVP